MNAPTGRPGTGRPIGTARPPGGVRPMGVPTGAGGVHNTSPSNSQRPNTGRMPPGTAAPRPGTARRPGTNAPPGGVNPTKRSIVSHGVGVSTPTGGSGASGRVVMDRTYYIQEMRTRISEMTTEVNKMNKEIETFESENAQAFQLEKQKSVLNQQVDNLKGSLAEYNLLIEKLRTSTDLQLDQIVQDRKSTKAANDAQKKNIDAIFTERSAIDAQSKEMEQNLLQMQQEVERQMNSLDANKREQYNSLKADNASLSKQVAQLQQELDALNLESQRIEEDMKQDPMKQKGLGLYDELYKLQKKKAELSEEIQKAQVSLPDERERLLQKVKVTNNDIALLERKTNDSLDLINQYKEQIAQMDRDMKETKSDKVDKFRELQQRDKEMSQFIDSFDETKKQQMETNTATELTIIALLEHISRGLAAQTNMPTVDALQQMKEDLKYKEGQLEKSKDTAEKLREELQYRQAEFDKMTNLDQKIASEMSVLKEKIKAMQAELETYNHVEDLKLDIEDSKRKLSNERNKLLYRKEIVTRQIQVITTTNDQKKKQLADSDNNTQLEILEKSLRHYEQNNYHMVEYIAAKGVESEYTGLATEVKQLLSEINAMCIQEARSGSMDV